MGSKNKKIYTNEEHLQRVSKYILDNIKSDFRCNRHKKSDFSLYERVHTLFMMYQCDNLSCPVRLHSDRDGTEFILTIFCKDNVKRTQKELPILQTIREMKLNNIL